MKTFGLKSIGAAMLLVTLVAWLSLALLARKPARGVEKTGEPGCAKCTQAGSVPMLAVCVMCRNVWDSGPAHWRWLFRRSVGRCLAQELASHCVLQPALKHLCLDCAARNCHRLDEEFSINRNNKS
jgi:hypothetical protein